MQMMSECPKTRPVDGLTALAPRLHRNGSLHVERLPSGTCRVVLRFRERIGERVRQRSCTLETCDVELDVARRVLVALQHGRRPERAWSRPARAIWRRVTRFARGLAPHDRHAVRTALRATGGEPGPLLLVVLALPSLLASRQRRRRGGRPSKRDGPVTTQFIQMVRTASAVGTASRFSPRTARERAPCGEPVLATGTDGPARFRPSPTRGQTWT